MPSELKVQGHRLSAVPLVVIKENERSCFVESEWKMSSKLETERFQNHLLLDKESLREREEVNRQISSGTKGLDLAELA